MKLHFVKMQALGNDFILLDNRKLNLKKIVQHLKTLCDRRFGIGADQVLFLENSKKADFKMRIFNADGSEVEMCGNGIRCMAKYIWNNKLETRNLPTGQAGSKLETRKLAIETLAGVIILKKTGSLIQVDMGKPVLDAKKIPVNLTGSTVKHPLIINGKTFNLTCVSMGNPHAVIIVSNVDKIPVSHYGPVIENHHIFPKRTNVEFVELINRNNIKMRVWERGVGETMACGTGASAAGVASSLLGLTGRKTTVHLPGGKLFIEWSEKDNHVYMTGPAEKVFEGIIEI